jgi:hypothetical protein
MRMRIDGDSSLSCKEKPGPGMRRSLRHLKKKSFPRKHGRPQVLLCTNDFLKIFSPHTLGRDVFDPKARPVPGGDRSPIDCRNVPDILALP